MNQLDRSPRPNKIRRAMLAAGLLALAPRGPLRAQITPLRRLSICEPTPFRYDTPAVIAQRFALYRAAGIGTLRTTVDWSDMEPVQGHWRVPTDLAYMQQALDAGFTLKLCPSTMGSIPQWFIEAHPEMLMRDQYGDASGSLSLSFWHPATAKTLQYAVNGMGQTLAGTGLLDAPNFIIVDYGPAAEPKYISSWNIDNQRTGALFWCYDACAVANFAASMVKYYDGIGAANAAWGTSFSAWSAVTLPMPGSGSTAFWNDILLWYRAGKRQFCIQQLAYYQLMMKTYGSGNPNLVTLLPGTHLPPEQWTETGTEAVATGAMLDSAFIIDLAARAGGMLQFTGAQNANELSWIRAYMASNGYNSTLLWGENVGSVIDSKDNPMVLVQNAMQHDLFGVEYNSAGNLFAADGVTPNAWFAVLQSAYTLEAESLV